MTREDGERALLEFAGFMKEPTVYVVGSQAIYGSFPDLDLGIVLASKDIDVFTVPYYESWWLPVVERFGSDSDFDLERGYYVDMVKPDLPRLPNGWEERAVRRTIGTIDIGGRLIEVVAVFPRRTISPHQRSRSAGHKTRTSWWGSFSAGCSTGVSWRTASRPPRAWTG